MTAMNRRSALALGATAATAPLFAWATPATAHSYGPTEGEELFPGVRVVRLGTRESVLTGYQNVEMYDVVFQPNAEFPVGEPMEHDMVCQITEGELLVKTNDMEFTAKTGDVWTCAGGVTTEGATNNGSVTAVMRLIYLIAA